MNLLDVGSEVEGRTITASWSSRHWTFGVWWESERYTGCHERTIELCFGPIAISIWRSWDV